MSRPFRIVRDAAGFRALRSEWEGLLGSCAFPTLFNDWAWRFHWWESFGGALFIVVALEERGPEGEGGGGGERSGAGDRAENGAETGNGGGAWAEERAEEGPVDRAGKEMGGRAGREPGDRAGREAEDWAAEREGDQEYASRPRTVGIFPFRLEGGLTGDWLTPLGSPDSDYLDILAEAGSESALLDWFFHDFLAGRPQIGGVSFRDVNERSPTQAWLRRAAPAGWFKGAPRERLCPYLPLPGDFDALLAGFSSAMRYAVRRKARRIERVGAVRFGRVAQPDELEQRLGDFIAQHQGRWRRRDRPGAFRDERAIAFHQRISRHFFADGRLRLYYLELDGRPAASYYLFEERGRLLFYLSGFDPELAAVSPGMVLLTRVIREAIDQGMTEFDFLRGVGAYKFQWTNLTRTNLGVDFVRKRPGPLLRFLGEQALRATAARVKRGLSQGVKARIRALLPRAVVRLFDPFFRP